MVYDWEHDAFEEGGESRGVTWDDLIGNYFIAGPATGRHAAISTGNAHAHVYASGNYLDADCNGKLDGAPIPESDLGPVTIEKQPFAPPPAHIDSAVEAYEKVVEAVGCSLHRDSVDARLIDDLTSLGQRGKIINSPDDVGGWGDLDTASAPFDLAVEGPVLRVAPGGQTTVTVVAVRKHFDGPIPVELRGLPPRLTASRAEIPKGQVKVELEVTADAEAAVGDEPHAHVRGIAADKGRVLSPDFTVIVEMKKD